MTQPYPLYEKLLNKVLQRGEKAIDISRVSTTINNISLQLTQEEAYEHYEEIHAFIIHYDSIYNRGVTLSSTPFDGKVMVGGKGVLNFMMNLPPLLQQIIAQYLEDEANPTD